VGQIVYRANAANGYTVVEAFELMSDPYLLPLTGTSSSYFVDARPHNDPFGVSRYTYDMNHDVWSPNQYQALSQSRFSTCDAGVEQSPRYNNHGLYDDIGEAMNHVENICNGTLVLKPSCAPGGVSIGAKGVDPEPEPKQETVDDAYERAMKGI